MAYDHLPDTLADIRRRIAEAAFRAGRDPEGVQLVGVSKTHPVEAVRIAHQHGLYDFGESRVQEALPKLELLSELRPIRWHFIGHLQTNKVKQVVGRFDLIHSVDSLKLAHELDRRARERSIVQSVLLEVNLSNETGKFGFRPRDVARSLEELSACSGLQVLGLMTMAPLSSNPEQVRPIFSDLRALAASLAACRVPHLQFDQLSMGMTNDYQVAIEEGATIVRIGSALFGERKQ